MKLTTNKIKSSIATLFGSKENKDKIVYSLYRFKPGLDLTSDDEDEDEIADNVELFRSLELNSNPTENRVYDACISEFFNVKNWKREGKRKFDNDFESYPYVDGEFYNDEYEPSFTDEQLAIACESVKDDCIVRQFSFETRTHICLQLYVISNPTDDKIIYVYCETD